MKRTILDFVLTVVSVFVIAVADDAMLSREFGASFRPALQASLGAALMVLARFVRGGE